MTVPETNDTAFPLNESGTDRLAPELAAPTAEANTDATRRAIEERIEPVAHRPGRGADLRGIIARGRARPLLDDRAEDVILGYGPDECAAGSGDAPTV